MFNQMSKVTISAFIVYTVCMYTNTFQCIQVCVCVCICVCMIMIMWWQRQNDQSHDKQIDTEGV